MKTQSAALLAALLLTAVTAQAFDLKGVELGQRATPAKLKAAFGDGHTQIEGAWVDASVHKGQDGAVDSITVRFDSGCYAQLRKAALAKFGTPSRTDIVPMRSGVGIQFNAEYLQWNDAAGARVWIVQYLGSASHGHLELQSARDLAAEQARNAAAKAQSKM
jgi:hypothetical protein